MCNINALITKKGIFEDLILKSFIQSVTSASFIKNNDGEGIFINNILERKKNKIDVFKSFSNIENINLCLAHERLATHGLSNKNIQPFLIKDFLFLHNGILSDYVNLNLKNSDSLNAFKEFIKNFYKNKDFINRQDRILKSLKDTFDLKIGSFSIILYDIKQKNIYYFKNESTNIHFYKNKDFIYFTTNSQNSLFLNSILTKKRYSEYKIKPFKIYLVDENLNIKKIGKLKRVNLYNYEKENLNNISLVNHINNFVKNDFIFTDKPFKCQLCNAATFRKYRKNNLYYCSLCVPDEQINLNYFN